MKKVLAILAAVIIIVVSVVPAFAESVDSPTPTKANYQITIIQTEGGTGSYEIKTAIDENGKQTVHFSAKPNEGYKFSNWEFACVYTALGAMTDSELDLVIESDIKATPHFTKIGDDNGGSKKSDTTDTKVDTGTKSPKTGYSVYTFAAISVASLAVVGLIILAKKRSSK